MDGLMNDDGPRTVPMEPGLEEATKILTNDLFEVHVVWKQYCQLYAEPETVAMLNRTAAMFFKVVQDQLWDSVLLGICRLVDPPEQGRQPRIKKNLTLRSLPPMITNADLRSKVEAACESARVATKFARNHRDKRIAHQDHDYARNPESIELGGVSRQLVEEMLAALVKVIQLIEAYYNDRDMRFHTFGVATGANRLLAVLKREERWRQERLGTDPA